MTGTGPGDYPPDDGDITPFDEDAYDFGDRGDDEGGQLAVFRPIPGGAACYFQPAQASVIRSLVSEVAELVRGEGDPGARAEPGQPDELEMLIGLSGNDELPDDPVLARLLPDAYSDDPGASAEFRRYTEESLRSAKIKSAQALLESLPAGGGEVVLNEAECQQWLRALNDVRLALGVMLGITDDDEDLADEVFVDDPRAALIMAYQWLGILQDSLLEALT
jgi:hypothetical protein